jgi:AraC family transcriptional regulator
MRGRHLFIAPHEIERILGYKPKDAAVRPHPFAAQSESTGGPSIVENLLQVLAIDLQNGCPSGPVFGQTVLSSVLQHVHAPPPELSGASRTSKRADRTVSETVDRIQSNLTGRISLTDLAGHAGVSVQYLCRVFRSSTGLSPHQYILRERVEMAKRLIRTGQMSYAEVAQAAGFADQSQMATTFKRVLGAKPSQFRNTE